MLFLLVLTAAVSALPSASPLRELPNFKTNAKAYKLCLYKDSNYRYDERCYSRTGIHEVPWHDEMSSLRIAPGCRVTIAEHPNMRGDLIQFSSDQHFVGWDWNDKASSFNLECGDIKENLVCVYRHIDLKGPSQCFNSEGNFNLASINSMSSFTLKEGCRLRLFEYHNQGGRKLSFYSGSHNLVPHDFDNEADSINIECSPGANTQPKLCLYKGKNYGTDELCFNEDGPQTNNLDRSWMNQVSSIRLKSPCRIVAATYPNLGDRLFTFPTSLAEMPGGWDNDIDSFKLTC